MHEQGGVVLLNQPTGYAYCRFVLSVVYEWSTKFWSWARRKKVRHYGAFAVSKPLDGSARVR